jgi:uncharacterized phiE125 gp8 family phage protein
MAYAIVPVRTAAPAEVPVTLAEVKAHLRISAEEDLEDVLIGQLIDGVTEFLDGWDGWLGLCLVTQTWRHDFAGGHGGELRLALPGARSAVVTYVDTSGVTQTLDPSQWDLVEDMVGSVILPKPNVMWPALGPAHAPMRVVAVHGFGSAAAVPAGIKRGICQMIADWYENRGTVSSGGATRIPLEASADRNLGRYRRVRFG